MYLVVGLGNPGKQYESTKHNVGFMCIDNLAKKFNTEITKEKHNGLYTQIEINNKKVILLKPQKYMNLSGEVIKKYINYFKINLENVIIIYDDMDINFGSIKLKEGGSSAGHNGLKNVEINLKTKDYKRLKIGISRNKNIETKNYVLSKFSLVDKTVLSQILDNACEAIEDCFYMEFSNVMNKYNKRQ